MDRDLQEFSTRMGWARDPLAPCTLTQSPLSRSIPEFQRIPTQPNKCARQGSTKPTVNAKYGSRLSKLFNGLLSLITDLNFQIKICFRKDPITYLTRYKINHKKCAKLNISFKIPQKFFVDLFNLLAKSLPSTTTHYAC